MEEIVRRYRGVRTPAGHELRVDLRDNEVVLWYLFWGEYRGVDDHHHFGVARVRRDGSKYVIGWMHGTEQEPRHTELVSGMDDVFKKLDDEISRR